MELRSGGETETSGINFGYWVQEREGKTMLKIRHLWLELQASMKSTSETFVSDKIRSSM